MKANSILLGLIVASFFASGSAASAAQLLQPATRDQVPARLVQPGPASGSHATSGLERATVQVSRPLESGIRLSNAPTPYVSHSREFWTLVSESQLRAGFSVTTTAPGAVIRMSPVAGAQAALDPDVMRVRFQGRELSATQASSNAVSAEALRRAGMPVARGTLAFKLSPDVGSGDIEIAAPDARGRYLIHVLDAGSTLVMKLSATRDTVLVGTPIRFEVDANDAGRQVRPAMVSGMVTAPDGHSATLDFDRNRDGSFSASFTPDAAHASGPALWEAHAFGATRDGKSMVLRDAKTAFAVSAPSAKLEGQADVQQGRNDLRVHLGIEIANASRYQLSGAVRQRPRWPAPSRRVGPKRRLAGAGSRNHHP